jgi:hypothetical protein
MIECAFKQIAHAVKLQAKLVNTVSGLIGLGTDHDWDAECIVADLCDRIKEGSKITWDEYGFVGNFASILKSRLVVHVVLFFNFTIHLS